MMQLKQCYAHWFVITALVSVLATLSTIRATAAPLNAKISWSPCYRDFGFPFECGIVQVPLDYSEPNGAAISLALIRLPASDPSRRIGSLFLNPGGPGGSGFEFALYIAPYIYTEEVRARFDIVGFDPRGVGRSTPLRCFGTVRQWSDILTAFAFPITEEQAALWESTERTFVDACEQRAGRIVDHMTTADVARDLDLLREAVGDEKLTYAGLSYGTFLGVTYANLFPDKVRAVVVDGVLDPIAWTTGNGNEAATLPFSTRLRSDAGAMATLDEFFRLCDAGGIENCAFAPDSSSRFAALAARLRVAPVLVTTPDGFTYTFDYAGLIATMLSNMYSSYNWPYLAPFLAELEATAGPAQLGARLQSLWNSLGLVTKRGMPEYPNIFEGFYGVVCSESDNPNSYSAWWNAAQSAEAQYGYFGPIWTWNSSVCAIWPGPAQSRYVGPFATATANPVLVVGNIFDPATRYEGALTVHNLLANSRLLTVQGWGHCSLFLSGCADSTVGSYLVDPTGPLPTSCAQEWVPFAAPPAAATAASVQSSVRESLRAVVNGAIMPMLVRHIVR